MKKEILGHTACPICRHADAEVKPDKNGHAFIFCPDCAAQTFTRNEHRHKLLMGHIRPVTVTVQEQTKQPEQPEKPIQPAQDKKPAAADKVPAVQKKQPDALPVKPEPVKKSSWFQPILGA
ncbi:hypothetical protein [Undibacterium curvum]|uniref:Uncharacterized protein n=1 Tax=Undibacterium curvum TaxID=2762294 RepID=A0ABR7A0H9_9BURK|nr:hypothetical protein [Undibacterium curvum]MBC3930369.1 hypothetical protein [Undibacterium curvum]